MRHLQLVQKLQQKLTRRSVRVITCLEESISLAEGHAKKIQLFKQEGKNLASVCDVYEVHEESWILERDRP